MEIEICKVKSEYLWKLSELLVREHGDVSEQFVTAVPEFIK